MDVFTGIKETLIGMGVDPDSIRPAANIVLDLDLDSLEMADLGVELENRFSITIPDDLWGAETVGDLVDRIREASAN